MLKSRPEYSGRLFVKVMLGRLSRCDLLASVLVDDHLINCVEDSENVALDWLVAVLLCCEPVSYTHLTLPTNREV